MHRRKNFDQDLSEEEKVASHRDLLSGPEEGASSKTDSQSGADANSSLGPYLRWILNRKRSLLIIMLITLLFYFLTSISFYGAELQVSSKEPKWSDRIGESFVFQIQGCTGSLIAPDWILSAAHCFQSLKNYRGRSGSRSGGDTVIEFDSNDDDEFSYVRKKPVNHRTGKSPHSWSFAVGKPKNRNKGSYWRRIDKIILHEKFESEAFSWKGYDLALIHLSNNYGSDGNDTETEQAIVPVCLAEKGFSEFDENIGPTFIAGFGRRRVPHCFTDDKGPEQYEVCGRPIWCTKDARTTKCGISFKYNGTEHKKCITDETPSASDPGCVKLRQAQPQLKGLKQNIHLFKNNKYQTTCYPELPSGQGWCVTRPQGVDQQIDPTYNRDWGFCSDAPIQSACNSAIPEVLDTADIATSVLEDKYCVDKLEANLKVEQPEADRRSYEPLLSKSKVFCVGRNYTKNFDQDLFYQEQLEGSYQAVQSSSALISQLVTVGRMDEHLIDGGPSCFGDSGGPLWRMVLKPEQGGSPTPVLIGVFSFMLWGTCIGRNEPGYYGQVSENLEWMYKYVPKTDVCTYSDKFKNRVQL